MAQPPKGGYGCEFVQRLPDVVQTECSICRQVLKEPHMISCCGHNFCKSCIEQVKKDGKNCPLCNEAGFSLMYNKGLERTLKGLEVYCTNCEVGCEWIGKLGVLKQHLNIDYDPEKQLEGCSFARVKCIHANCVARFERRFLGNHQTECPKRPFSCDYCREYESTFEDVAYHHYPVCKCYPLPCPNNCIPDTIEHQNLQHHLDNDCPLQVVNCDFQYAGCEAKLPRKDMPAHLAENYSHITLLSVLNQRLAQKNNDMAAKLLEKDEQIERLTMSTVELKSSLEMLHHHMRVAPIQITMTEFNQHKSVSDIWYSDPFYTHPHGYKMCLRVDANGNGSGKGTHISVFIFLMRGDFDNHLQWPFRGRISIQLLNQLEDKNHQNASLSFSGAPDEHTSRVTTPSGRAVRGLGQPEFIAHNYRSINNCRYVEENCLKFLVNFAQL